MKLRLQYIPIKHECPCCYRQWFTTMTKVTEGWMEYNEENGWQCYNCGAEGKMLEEIE